MKWLALKLPLSDPSELLQHRTNGDILPDFDHWGPETVEIYSKVIFDDILHFADTKPESIEGWGANGIAKILATIDHAYAEIIQAFYTDVQRRLSGEYEMWAEIDNQDVRSIRFAIDGEDYFFDNRFIFYEGEALPEWKPFG